VSVTELSPDISAESTDLAELHLLTSDMQRAVNRVMEKVQGFSISNEVISRKDLNILMTAARFAELFGNLNDGDLKIKRESGDYVCELETTFNGVKFHAYVHKAKLAELKGAGHTVIIDRIKADIQKSMQDAMSALGTLEMFPETPETPEAASEQSPQGGELVEQTR
jgi:hypothetical protein